MPCKLAHQLAIISRRRVGHQTTIISYMDQSPILRTCLICSCNGLYNLYLISILVNLSRSQSIGTILSQLGLG